MTQAARPTSPVRSSQRFAQWLENEQKQNGLLDCKLMASANADASMEDCAADAYHLVCDDDGRKVSPYHEVLAPEYH